MKELSRRTAAYGEHNPETNETTVVQTVTTVEILDDLGNIVRTRFDHDPTDDEIIAALPPKPALRNVRPSNVADRIDAGAQLAARYLALRQLTDLPDFTTLFTAQERNRITNGRDQALADVKGFI